LQAADTIIKNTYRTLMTRGMKGCYVYCCDPSLAEHFKELMAEKPAEAEIIRIEPVVNDDVKFIDFLPVYSIKAACGYFGEGDDVSELGWIQVEGVGKLNRNMFVVQASGHSMEPRINDGDFCVFRANPAGSRQGKIVLVQHHNYYDSDYAGAYSIKEYRSSKSYDQFGNWQHEKIELLPLNKDYNPIVIDELESEDFRVIGEFIGIID
jgi:SOS-response transcriptional repressor LexA